MKTDQEKRKNLLDATLVQINKKYGQGIIMKLDDKAIAKVPVLSTGSIALNQALVIQGIPLGRITEIYGPEACGKTTLALHLIAELQKKKGTPLLIDTEHAFDPVYAKALGIDTGALLICQPDSGEQALNIAEECIKSGTIELIVIDSVSALTPQAELKGDMGHQNVGGQARLMSQAMRKLTAIIHKSGVICVFINQIRHKIGTFFGSPETTSGGNALKFYASIRLELRRIEQIKNKENEPIGHKVKAKIVKNKLAPPFKEAKFDILYGKGIDQIGEIADYSIKLGFIEKKGNWFYLNTEQVGQGRETLLDFLHNHPDIAQSLQAKITMQIKASTAN